MKGGGKQGTVFKVKEKKNPGLFGGRSIENRGFPVKRMGRKRGEQNNKVRGTKPSGGQLTSGRC